MNRQKAHLDTQSIIFKLASGGCEAEASDEIESVIKTIYDEFEKEVAQLKRDREYWKLSFNKQVEASRAS